MDKGDYARAQALVLQSMLIECIEASFPTFTKLQQNDILLDILDRLALRMGWTIKRNGVDADGEE